MILKMQQMKRRVIVFFLLICLIQAVYAQEKVFPKQESFRPEGEVPAPEISLPTPSLERKPWMRNLRVSPEARPLGLDTTLYGRIGWTKKEQEDLLLLPYPVSGMIIGNHPRQHDFSSSGTIAENGFFSVYGQSRYEEYPNLLVVQSASLGLGRDFGSLHLQIDATANRYFARRMATQYGLRGQLTYQFADRLGATLFGQYYTSRPYFSLAALPFVSVPRYGGYMTWSARGFAIDMGAQRYYDSFGRKWIMEPIVTPRFNISKKVKVELPLGGLVRTVVEKASAGRHGRGPVIPPPGN